MSMRWYVVHAYSGFENQVMRMLRNASNASMQSEFGDVLVPTEEVVEMRPGRNVARPQVFPRLRARSDEHER